MVESLEVSTVEGYRLSPQQKNLWSLQQAVDGQHFWALSAILIEGDLNENILHEAVARIVARHEILRTTFSRPPGIKTPFQVVGEAPKFSWRSVDLSDLDVSEMEVGVEELFTGAGQQPFDFAHDPPLSATLIRQSSMSNVLLLSLPALCGDPATLANLIRELGWSYMSDQNKEQPAQDPMQYADFAEWQYELLEAEDEAAVRGKLYWRNQNAADSPTPTLPFEKRLTSPREFAPSSITLDLRSVQSKIEALAEERATSVSAVFFACWQAFVWRLLRGTESGFLIYNLTASRKFDDLVDALGLYAKYLPISCHCKNESFVEHLRRVSAALREADEWQEYCDPDSFTNSVGNSIAFDFEERQAKYDVGSQSFSVIKQSVCLSRFKLKLSCVRSEASLSAELCYDETVFDREAVVQIAGCFQHFLANVLEDPQQDLREIEIVGAAERRRLLLDLNQIATEFSSELATKTIHELFEMQVTKTPTALALVSGDQELTYDELNSRANQLANLLRRGGVGPDVCVGLCVERSVEMIIGMLGVLKAGGAYVPLNPDHPRERLAIQLAESKSSFLITNGGQFAFAGQTIDLQRDRSLLEAEPKLNPQTTTTPDNLVYVIYTSGSTGIPKGVAVRHRNLVNYSQFILQRLDIHGPLSFATVSTISADLGNTCIFPSLLSGGCLHVLGFDVAMEGDLLKDYVSKHPIDVLKIVPSHLTSLLASQPDGGILPEKYLILGGEALSWELVQRISTLPHTCRIINHYGPTETTVGSLTFSVEDESSSLYSSSVPIGRPIANTRCYILDDGQRLVAPGCDGELYIGGAGVAAGYLNQPAETAARFVPDPFAGDSNSRLYRTGDLARYLVDGNIEFLGRTDHQVKVRGYRVELGEIEAILSARAGVRQAVVTVNDQTGDNRIVAYLVSAPTSQDELRATLRQQLPDYMIPSAFIFLNSMPLTPNGKVDRAALPSPDDTRPGLRSEFLAPRSQVEKELASIWAGLLKVGEVGVHDNFFDLGGHSLLATQVMSRMRKEFHLEIPLRSLFETPTVAALAEEIEKARTANTARLLAELEQLSDDDVARLLEKS